MYDENTTWNLGYAFINFLEIELDYLQVGLNSKLFVNQTQGLGWEEVQSS